MKDALEQCGRLLPANAQATVVLDPANGAFNSQAPFVATEWATVLCYVLELAILAVRRDQLNALFRKLFFQFVAVIRHVADHTVRVVLRQHEIEQPLRELALVWACRRRVDCHWQPAVLAAGSWRALCVIGVCLILGCQTPSGNGRPMRRDSATVRQCLETHWEAIRNWRPETPYDEYDDKLEWWADVIMSSYEHMWLACYHVGPETALPFFVKQFGKHGAEVDFRLLMGGVDLLLPQHYHRPAEDWRQSTPATKKAHQVARQAQLAAAKAQVEFFLRNPALLGRYYHALVWSRQFFGSPRYHFLSLEGKYYSLCRSFPREP